MNVNDQFNDNQTCSKDLNPPCYTASSWNEIKDENSLSETDKRSPFIVIIPDGTTQIGRSAFPNCSGMTSVTIPEGSSRSGTMPSPAAGG